MSDNKKDLPIPLQAPKGYKVEDKKTLKAKRRATDKELDERREKIVELVGEFGGLTNKEIAKHFNVSEPTIERDIRAIKEQSWGWVHKLAKEGYVYECRLAFSKLSTLSRKLNRRIIQGGDNLDVDDLTRLAAQIARLETLKIQIIQQPTLYALRMAVKKVDEFEDLLVGE